MGLFDFVGNIANSIGNVVNTVVTHPLQSIGVGASNIPILNTVSPVVAAVVANPITAITKGIPAAQQQTINSSLSSNVTKIVLNTGAIAAGTAAVATYGLGGIVVPILKTVAANPIASVVGAAAIPVAYGAVTQNPVKAVSTAATAVNNLQNFGNNVGGFLNNPSLSNAATIVKDNPIISTIAAGAAALAAGTAANTIATIINTHATNANSNAGTQPIQTPASDTQTPVINLTNNIPAASAPVTGSSSTGVVAPPNQKVTKKKTTKKKKKAKKKTTKKVKKKKASKKKRKK